MYLVRSDLLPWERLRTGVRGPEAMEEGRRWWSPVREREKKRKRRGRNLREF
jgi:hypothetical protein